MQIVNVAARQIAAGALLEELALRPGASVVGRVVDVADGGRGTISLAGALISAKLPEGVAAGERLQLQVVGQVDGELILRLKTADQDPARPHHLGRLSLARAAGALAVSGDGEVVKAAVELQQPGFALPLPNGDAAEIRVGDEEQDPSGRRDSDGEASFVLHSVALGPIEVRLRLVGGTVRAGVVVEPHVAPDALAAAPLLARGLERATGAMATVDVSAREDGARRPARPVVPSELNRYA